MSNLIYANIKRIYRTRFIRNILLIVAQVGLLQIVSLYIDFRKGTGSGYFDEALFSIAALGIFPLAIIIALFLGTEYNDGTLRNKLMVGHSRTTIYLANLITALIIGGAIILLWTAAYQIPGVVLLKNANPLWVYLEVFLLLGAEFAALAAIFTFVTMTIGKKAAASIVCLMLTVTLLMAGAIIQSLLAEPEYYSPEYVITEDGSYTTDGEPEVNPNYIPEGSTKRQVYELLDDTLPGNQALHIAQINPGSISRMLAGDAVWLVVTTAMGIVIFRRKDLK